MNIDRPDMTTLPQKGVAVGLGVGALAALWWILPPLIVIMTNLWIAAFLAVPIMLVAFNPQVVWNSLKLLSWNMTKKLIKADMLGHMYQYHQYILTKIEAVDSSMSKLAGAQKQLATVITKAQNENVSACRTVESYERQNKEAEEENVKLVAFNRAPKELPASEYLLREQFNIIKVTDEQIKAMTPQYETIIQQETYLRQLRDLWRADAKELLYTLDAKKLQYETLKTTAIAIGHAKEFLGGNTEQAKIFNESMKQLEISVAGFAGDLDKFEKDAKPIMQKALLGQNFNADEGKRLLEEYQQKRLQLTA